MVQFKDQRQAKGAIDTTTANTGKNPWEQSYIIFQDNLYWVGSFIAYWPLQRDKMIHANACGQENHIPSMLHKQTLHHDLSSLIHFPWLITKPKQRKGKARQRKYPSSCHPSYYFPISTKSALAQSPIRGAALPFTIPSQTTMAANPAKYEVESQNRDILT